MNDYKERALVLIDILQTRHVLTMREKGLLRRAILENEPKKGEWIDEPIKGVRCHCSLCYGRFDYEWKYCPNCGADMREGRQ